MKKEIYKNLKYLPYTVSFVFPIIASAQSLRTLETLVREAGNIIRLTTPIVFGLALLFFIWGMAIFILNAGEPKMREEGKQRMIWGIVAMFVIISIFGLAEFINRSLGINPNPTGGYLPPWTNQGLPTNNGPLL